MAEEKKEEKKDQKFDLSTKVTLDSIKSQDSGFVVCIGDKTSTPTKGKRIFMRADFNVPLSKDDCKITDDTRITSVIPTIKKLLEFKPDRLIITSHLGRPKGIANDKLSLAPVASKLEELLGTKVALLKDWFRDDLESEILSKYESGSIILLENCRFYKEETTKGADADSIKRFQTILTSIADLCIIDAFGTCHRAHSSMVGCAAPIKAAGFLVKKELTYFNKALSEPSRPYLAILGGAKVSDKIKVINSLLDRVNEMIIAGGMCFTFLKVIKNMNIGKSLYDDDGAKIVNEIMEKAKKNGVNIILPCDFVCGDKFSNDAKIEKCDVEKGINDPYMGLDVGEKSIKIMCEAVMRAKTVIFNGPPGVFEMENFSNGTKALVEALANATKNGCITIIGGGDSASACNNFGYGDKVSHISTGGGASLELLEGKVLPGVAFLSDTSSFK
eukprot:325950_1